MYDNDTKNTIEITREYGALEVACNDCGAYFGLDDGSADYHLYSIGEALDKVLDLPSRVEVPIDKDGVIESEHYTWEVTSRDAGTDSRKG